MVPRPKLPRRKPKDDASEAKTKEAASTKADAKAAEAKAAKATAKKPAAAKSAGAAKGRPPAPNLQERMEGLQGWMAEIERKQGRMTYFGGAAVAVAVLASAAALYLGITNQQDSADKDDFEALETRVTQIGDSLKSSTEEQLKTLNGRLQTIEQRLDAIEQRQKQTDTTISALQTQVDSQSTAKGGTTTTPGAQVTPIPKPTP